MAWIESHQSLHRPDLCDAHTVSATVSPMVYARFHAWCTANMFSDQEGLIHLMELCRQVEPWKVVKRRGPGSTLDAPA